MRADLLERTERAKAALIECSLLLSRAARWTFGIDYISPGHWFARKARKHWRDAARELEAVRVYFASELPQAEVPSAREVLGEELAGWIGVWRVETNVQRWKWPTLSPFDAYDSSFTFEQRMLTTKLEIDNLLEAVSVLSAKLRVAVR